MQGLQSGPEKKKYFHLLISDDIRNIVIEELFIILQIHKNLKHIKIHLVIHISQNIFRTCNILQPCGYYQTVIKLKLKLRCSNFVLVPIILFK